VESDSSSEDEENNTQQEPISVIVATVAEIGNNAATPAGDNKENNTPKEVTIDSRKKSPLPSRHGKKKSPAKSESAKKKKNTNDENVDLDDDPRIDPPALTLPNLLEMEEAFNDGYDSDGWQGPSRGTLCDEADEIAEEALPVVARGTRPLPPPAPPIASVAINTAPVHIPIDNETLMKMTAPMLKHELTVRKVSLKGLGNKPKLQERLKKMLQMEQPVCSSTSQIAVNNKQKDQKKEDDMSAFAIGVAWKELTLTIDVPEPDDPEHP